MSDLLGYNQGNVNQGVVNSRENRVDVVRRRNNIAQHAAERMFEDKIQANEKIAKRIARSTEQDDRLAKELERRRTEELRQEREIQRICEESEELRELEARLKLAYMNKERASQHEERAMLEEMERARDAAIDDQMEHDRKVALMREYEKEELRRTYQVEAKLQLQEQIIFRQEQMAEAAREAEMDKLKVDSIVRRIEAEDQAEMQGKSEKVVQTRKAISDYQNQRERELEQRREEAAAEEARIRGFQEQQRAREATIQAASNQRREQEEARFNAIKAEVERQAREEEELARLRDELWEEETEAKLMDKEHAAADRRSRMRSEMVAANATQRVMKQALRQQLMEEDRALKEKMQEKFLRDQEADRMAEQMRENERTQYVSSIDSDVRNKRSMVEGEKQREMDALRAAKEEEAFKQRVVEEARRRLLEAHASQLDGYLPKGVVKRPEDKQLIQAQARGRESAALQELERKAEAHRREMEGKVGMGMGTNGGASDGQGQVVGRRPSGSRPLSGSRLW